MSATRGDSSTSASPSASSGTPAPAPAPATSTRTSNQQPASSAPSEPVSLRPEQDAERESALRRMKAWATGLLVLATIIFVVAKLFESRYPWLAIVVATAEASMVGALADWFAVTALFKHP